MSEQAVHDKGSEIPAGLNGLSSIHARRLPGEVGPNRWVKQDRFARVREVVRLLLDPMAVMLITDELTALTESERAARIRRASIFARISPEQKFLIVDALKNDGAIVAMTGDGVNDAPALHRADIRIAMGQRGTDVARATADLVLLDDNFASIVATVREGRHIFQNIQRAFLYLIAFHIPIVCWRFRRPDWCAVGASADSSGLAGAHRASGIGDRVLYIPAAAQMFRVEHPARLHVAVAILPGVLPGGGGCHSGRRSCGAQAVPSGSHEPGPLRPSLPSDQPRAMRQRAKKPAPAGGGPFARQICVGPQYRRRPGQ